MFVSNNKVNCTQTLDAVTVGVLVCRVVVIVVVVE